jgi:glucose-6-phosphate 1-dehydrogenase
LDGWKTQGKTRLPEYPAGAWGPAEADDFIQADGRAWRTM